MTHKIELRAAALYKLTRNAKVRDVAVEHLRALLRVLLAKPEFFEPVQIDNKLLLTSQATLTAGEAATPHHRVPVARKGLRTSRFPHRWPLDRSSDHKREH